MIIHKSMLAQFKPVLFLTTLIKISKVHAFSFSTNKVQILYNSNHNKHRDIQYHPENYKRIEVCLQTLKDFQNNNLDQEKKHQIQLIDCVNSTTNEELQHARAILTEIHSEEYVSKIQQKCENAKQARINQNKDSLGFVGYIDGGDTFVTTHTYDVALSTAAIWIKAAHDAMSKSQNQFNFALTRPPGHHATKTLANGFCIFNFAAAAAFSIMRKHEKKVLILDWDVHYGQGVSDIVKNYPDFIRYISLHQTPAFPYQGQELKQEDNIMTIPLKPGTTWDNNYKDLFIEHALPFMYDWNPDLVIVCAGYDAMKEDELANVNLVPSDYANIVRLLKKKGVPLMLGLEGGYQLRYIGLRDGVLETVKALLE